MAAPVAGDAESLSSLQRQGQDLYRKCKYVEALGCFDKVISQEADPPLSAFDNRAATKLRLKDLPGALRDGRRMIKLDQKDVKGYLRTGQVLLKMGEIKTAYKIYGRGLRFVPIEHADHATLEAVYQNTLKENPEHMAVDPFSVLPVELILTVMDRLSFNNVVSLLRVSRSWRNVVGSLPTIWKHLDLSRARRPVPMRAIRACVRRAQRRLTHATIYRAGASNDDALKHVIGHCRKLEHLELKDGLSNDFLLSSIQVLSQLTTLILGPERSTTLADVAHLLRRCPTLVRAEFLRISGADDATWENPGSDGTMVAYPNLRVLKLVEQRPPATNSVLELSLAGLCDQAPYLQDLCIRGWTNSLMRAPDFYKFQSLLRLEVVGFPSSMLPPVPASLQTLMLTGPALTRSAGVFDLHHIKELLSSLPLPKLTDLSFHTGQDSISIAPIRPLLESSRATLKTLSLVGAGGNPQILDLTADIVKDDLFRHVKKLTLGRMGINDDIAVCIASHCPSLVELDMAGNIQITGVGVKALVFKPGKRLRKLGLVDCIGVGVDAVQLARKEGIDVDFRFPDEVKTRGKRVRSF